MKLNTWTATPGRAGLIVAGTDQDGVQVALTDVVRIENDARRGTTVAIRENGETVKLS